MRSLAFALLTLAAACEPTASDVPVDGQLPVVPGASPIVLSEIVPGQNARVTFTDLTPGDTVFFGISLAQGSGPCPAALQGDCLDLVNPSVLGVTQVDSLGNATLTFRVPRALPSNRTVYAQAAVFVPGRVYTFKSPVASRFVGQGVCPAVFAPVCGSNGTTYSNACESELTGWPVSANGPCP